MNYISLLNGIIPSTGNLILALVAIIIYNKVKVKPKAITKADLSKVAPLIILIILLMIIFIHLTSPVNQVSTDTIILDIFNILVLVGTVLLAFGYIAGLIINAIYAIKSITMSIFFILQIQHLSLVFFINFFFSMISFIIFLLGYIKNKKLLKN